MATKRRTKRRATAKGKTTKAKASATRTKARKATKAPAKAKPKKRAPAYETWTVRKRRWKRRRSKPHKRVNLLVVATVCQSINKIFRVACPVASIRKPYKRENVWTFEITSFEYVELLDSSNAGPMFEGSAISDYLEQWFNHVEQLAWNPGYSLTLQVR